MTHEEKIQELRRMCNNYIDECIELESLCNRWYKYDDAMADPGLQYEQGEKLERLYKELKEYTKTL